MRIDGKRKTYPTIDALRRSVRPAMNSIRPTTATNSRIASSIVNNLVEMSIRVPHVIGRTDRCPGGCVPRTHPDTRLRLSGQDFGQAASILSTVSLVL